MHATHPGPPESRPTTGIAIRKYRGGPRHDQVLNNFLSLAAAKTQDRHSRLRPKAPSVTSRTGTYWYKKTRCVSVWLLPPLTPHTAQERTQNLGAAQHRKSPSMIEHLQEPRRLPETSVRPSLPRGTERWKTWIGKGNASARVTFGGGRGSGRVAVRLDARQEHAGAAAQVGGRRDVAG